MIRINFSGSISLFNLYEYYMNLMNYNYINLYESIYNYNIN